MTEPDIQLMRDFMAECEKNTVSGPSFIWITAPLDLLGDGRLWITREVPRHRANGSVRSWRIWLKRVPCTEQGDEG